MNVPPDPDCPDCRIVGVWQCTQCLTVYESDEDIPVCPNPRCAEQVPMEGAPA